MRGLGYIAIIVLFVCSCSTHHKLRIIRDKQLQAQVAMSDDNISSSTPHPDSVSRDAQEHITTVEVQNIKGESIIMNAVKDDESGEMIAVEELDAIVVEAKFRNLAERNGYVDIAFDIIVPQQMQDASWQLRFQPQFYILGDTLNLDELLITGEKYREEQLKGYAQYNKYVKGIIADTANFHMAFTKEHLLDVFLERNVRRTPSSFFRRYNAKSKPTFDISEQEAIDYYTRHNLIRKNNKKKDKQEEMFYKYVTDPIKSYGVRLDSVITNVDGTIRYNYVQTVKTKRNLRKVEMVLAGEIYNSGGRIYNMPKTAPLTFFISSMSAFTDSATRYIQKIIYRNAEANTAANISFKVGRFNIDDTLANNAMEICRIKESIRNVLSAPDYVVDSVVIAASCSPEGSYAANAILAKNRANSIKDYFDSFIRQYRDSVSNSVWEINLAGEEFEEQAVPEFEIITKSYPEEWDMLYQMILKDTSFQNKSAVLKCFEIEDLDSRERALQKTSDYKHIKDKLYSSLRTVKFDFFLHRKGMIKDTVHTTEVDTAYMEGVKALEERDYERAVELLRPYMDYNSAVAFVCMDYNQSALSVLETLERTAQRDYMLSVVYSRLGKEQKAVEYFIQSVEQDYSMRHRGNLDPEVSQLIKKYDLDTHIDNLLNNY